MSETEIRKIANVEFDAEEQKANSALIEAMQIIIHDWNLYEGNRSEVAAAIHTIQLFIIQHMLQRVGANGFNPWYGRDAEDVQT